MGGVTSKPEDICSHTRVRDRAEPRAGKSESREARIKVSPTANFQFVSPGFGSQFNGWFSWNSDEVVLLHQAGQKPSTWAVTSLILDQAAKPTVVSVSRFLQPPLLTNGASVTSKNKFHILSSTKYNWSLICIFVLPHFAIQNTAGLH